MKINDKVTVTGTGYFRTVHNKCNGIVYDLSEGTRHPITVEFQDGTIDAFERGSVEKIFELTCSDCNNKTLAIKQEV